MVNSILVAVDGSSFALRATRIAAEIVDRDKPGRLTLLYVGKCEAGLEWFQGPAQGEIANAAKQEQVALEKGCKEAEGILQEAFAVCSNTIKSGQVRVERMVVYGDPAQLIREQAHKENYSMIVMGSRGIGALRSTFLGSVSYKVLKAVGCPVLIVK